ncbi:MAG: hypothetical protein Q7S17_10475 [Xanthobacteraceae bacterium]|nr:hypothetical protein [Xanthobacteraceae bacterium]
MRWALLAALALGLILFGLFGPWPARAQTACQTEHQWLFLAGREAGARYSGALKMERWSGQLAQRIFDRASVLASQPLFPVDGLLVVTGAPAGVAVAIVTDGYVCRLIRMTPELYRQAVDETAGHEG